MNIVNLLHKGDEVLKLSEISTLERKKIALQLSIQALEPLGYVLESQKKTKK